MLVLPPVSYGYCHHVMDFPGTINVQPTTFVNLLIDIATSVAYHGFTRIVLVNGHGSNHPLVEQAARQVTLRTGALCLNISWWQLIADYWNEEVRESGPGGSAHACELETSMYLHIDGDRVRKDRVKGALADYLTGLEGGAEWQMADLTLGSGPATIVEWTSSTTETGSFGAPELATAEKGRLVFERTTERLVELVDWFRTRPASERQEHHAKPPSFPCRSGSERGTALRALRRARRRDDLRGCRRRGARRRGVRAARARCARGRPGAHGALRAGRQPRRPPGARDGAGGGRRRARAAPSRGAVAVIGELMALQAQVRGAAAVLVDGAVRDVDEIVGARAARLGAVTLCGGPGEGRAGRAARCR